MDEAPFLNLEEGMTMLINQYSKYLKNPSSYSGAELAHALNYRDDLQKSLESNSEIPAPELEQILSLDETLHRYFFQIKDKLDKNFVAIMRKTYPSSHWWWHL
jgi:hypothetical protein